MYTDPATFEDDVWSYGMWHCIVWWINRSLLPLSSTLMMRQCVPLKCWYMSTRLCIIISQKILIAMRTCVEEERGI